MELPGGSAGKESACSVGDLGLIPDLGRSPWRREQLPTPVFWPGEFHGLYSPWGCQELDMTEWHSLSVLLQSPPAGDKTNAQMQMFKGKKRLNIHITWDSPTAIINSSQIVKSSSKSLLVKSSSKGLLLAHKTVCGRFILRREAIT